MPTKNNAALTKAPSAADEAFNTAAEALQQGKTLQKIETPYVTAVNVQKPRSLVTVEKKCLEEATLAGETCFYGWGAGKDRVEGPSIECAMIALRNWGNAFAGARESVEETPSAYIFTSAFVDLETGVTYQRQFRQSKAWRIYGKMDEARKEDVRFQIGQSKADRNVILRALPSWLIDKMLDKAKEGVREKIEQAIEKRGIESVRKLALDALARFGITLERIESKYEKKYAAWDIETLVMLKADLSALTNGLEGSETLFPSQTQPEAAKAAIDLKDMQAGDPNQHQPHEPPAKSTTHWSDDIKTLDNVWKWIYENGLDDDMIRKHFQIEELNEFTGTYKDFTDQVSSLIRTLPPVSAKPATTPAVSTSSPSAEPPPSAPAAANGNGEKPAAHWIDNSAQGRAFRVTAEKHKLAPADVLKIMGVADLHHYKGTFEQAITHLLKHITQPAAPASQPVPITRERAEQVHRTLRQWLRDHDVPKKYQDDIVTRYISSIAECEIIKLTSVQAEMLLDATQTKDHLLLWAVKFLRPLAPELPEKLAQYVAPGVQETIPQN